jgi:hypothetical protein
VRGSTEARTHAHARTRVALVLSFGDPVVVVEPVADLVIGDLGEVVGFSDDQKFVGVMIDRVRQVYSLRVECVSPGR